MTTKPPRKANGSPASSRPGQDLAGAKLAEMTQMAIRQYQTGNLAVAEMMCRSILELSPGNVDVLNLLGVVQATGGQAADAVATLRAAVAQAPGRVDILINLATVLTATGSAADAEALLRPVADAADAGAPALLTLSDALRAQGRMGDAETATRRAIVASPDSTRARVTLGTLLVAAGRLAEAEQEYRAAVSIAPKDQTALVNLGALMLLDNRFDEARTVLKRADDQGFKPDIRRMLALATLQAGDAERAVALCKSIEIFRPLPAEAEVVLGDALSDLGRFDESLAAYDRALALDPAGADARGKKALVQLALGDFQSGWENYEARRDADPRIAALLASIPLPEWDGGPLDGKRLLVVCEQGLGDSIQFCRFVRPLADRGATVAVACQPELGELLQGLDGASEVTSFAEASPADLMVLAGSLPRLLGAHPGHIPGAPPYLTPDAGRVAKWRHRLEATGHPRVGVLLRLANRPGTHSRRSLAPSDMAPLLAVPGVAFHDLSVEQFDMPLPGPVTSLGAEIRDFADTAAVLATLDLVITVDTVMAHLAGALGRPTWLLVRQPAEWRWGQDSSHSPWYPSMRILRQSGRGDWSAPVADAAAALAELAHG